MSSQSAIQKSRVPRLRRRLPVRFGEAGGPLGQIGYTFDLSARGLGLSAARVPSPGTRISVAVSLPEGVTGLVEGIVTWSHPGLLSAQNSQLMGVRLTYTDEEFLKYASTLPGGLMAQPFAFEEPPIEDGLPTSVESLEQIGALSTPRMPRWRETLPMRLWAVAADDVARGFTEDVSRNGLGLLCATATTPALGSRVLVAVTTPSGQVARASGTVAWVRPTADADQSAVGVQLSRCDDEWMRLVDEVAGG